MRNDKNQRFFERKSIQRNSRENDFRFFFKLLISEKIFFAFFLSQGVKNFFFLPSYVGQAYRKLKRKRLFGLEEAAKCHLTIIYSYHNQLQ